MPSEFRMGRKLALALAATDLLFLAYWTPASGEAA
jgi:hypothetical protein